MSHGKAREGNSRLAVAVWGSRKVAASTDHGIFCQRHNIAFDVADDCLAYRLDNKDLPTLLGIRSDPETLA